MMASLHIAGLMLRDIASYGKSTSGNTVLGEGKLFTVFRKQRHSFAFNARDGDTFYRPIYMIFGKCQHFPFV